MNAFYMNITIIGFERIFIIGISAKFNCIFSMRQGADFCINPLYNRENLQVKDKREKQKSSTTVKVVWTTRF